MLRAALQRQHEGRAGTAALEAQKILTEFESRSRRW
jgi:hypothetical protein